jgi:hypothetical protein
MFGVFVGSSTEGRKKAARKVVELINEHPLFTAVPWWEKSIWRSGSSFYECLSSALHQVAFGIFVATPDDLVRKRGREKNAIRDNVLFEYGLFAGFLGRHNTILLQVGESELPSDLRGINVEYVDPTDCRKNRLRPHIQKCLDDLLRGPDDNFHAAIADIRDAQKYLDIDDITAILSSAMRRRIDVQKPVIVPQPHLSDLLERCRCETERIVGLPGHQTRISDYIDPGKLNTRDLRMLSATYARFVAKQIAEPGPNGNCATRIAIHLKNDLKFISAVLLHLRVFPVIVDIPDDERTPPRVLGRCVPGERAILLHDFTRSGNTPRECAAALLENRRVTTQSIISFFVTERSRPIIEATCVEHGFRFKSFGVLTPGGEFKVGDSI